MREQMREKTPKKTQNDSKMPEVVIYTDGACKGNPGPGGYAAILTYLWHEKIIRGGEANTTNNRMELTALILALESLTKKCKVKVYSDSKYIVDAIEKGWLENWKNDNWKKSDGKPVLNRELWERLDKQLQKHNVTFEWVKGHNGNEYNEMCDRIAVEESNKF